MTGKKHRIRNPILRRFMRRKVSVVAAVVLMLFVLIAIFGPVIYPVDPLKQSVMQKYGPITWEHPLGTDNLGRDTLARMIHGARTSLSISFAGVLSGAFTTVNSCRTRDLCTAGKITVRVRAELDAQTSRKDAKFALWKLADGRAEYLETVYFTCDGTVQSYTFTGLAAGARYRVVFSYTESGARRMSGAFNVEGVTAEIEEETQEEGAVAAGAQPGS